VTEQNEGSRPARRRVVRKAAAPVQTPPPSTPVDTPAADAPAPAVDLGAELSELASPPAKKATRSRKAPPVKAVSDLVIPSRADDGGADDGATREAVPAGTDDGSASADAPSAGDAAVDDARPAKRTPRKRATKAAAKATQSAPTDSAPAESEAVEAASAEPAATEPQQAEEAQPKKATRSRMGGKSKKSAEPEAEATQSTTGDEPAPATAATAAPGGAGSSPRLATTAVLFQAPDPALARPKRRRVVAEAGSPQKMREQVEATEDEDLIDEEAVETDTLAADAESAGLQDDQSQDDQSQGDEPQDEDDESQDGSEDSSSGASRRRRRRGGRGRRSKGSSDDQADESASGADTTDAEDESGSDAPSDADGDEESSSRRRRRRRSRSGRSGDSEEPRSSRSDEVTALRGSTRLEAKRQRRREGRDAGRRRQVLTEAEFLARREAVERAMVVRESNGRTQIAVLEDGVLAEHYVSRSTQASMVGNVYLGRVQNVLPSMEAAFVDVGKGRNAVLYAGEVNWDAAGLEGQPRRIETALKSGDSVLVQVTKDPIGHKGARLTSQVTLAGRYLVFVPGAGMTGISRKLPEKERARLKKLLREIVPENSGVIVRTAAEGASEEELRADIARLTEQWAKIEKKSKSASAPALLQGEADLAIRVVRDIFNDDFSSLVVQGAEAWDTISGYVGDLAPDLSTKLSRWTGEKDVFAEHRIDEQIAKAMDRKVWLPSGGSLVIDRTEAMTVVDVNTGKFTGTGGTLEETVTRNNLEAAEEIVRQLRLRDIGGIIVIDFIDMVLESNRDLVLRRLVECLGRDRTKHQVAEVTSLGLVQMTRKRVGQGLLEAFSETCDHCAGRGYIVHDHPVAKGESSQPEESAEPKKSRRSRKSPAKEPVPHTPVPVLPAERDKVNATLATIAAAAAHAHEHEHDAEVATQGEGQNEAQGEATSAPSGQSEPVAEAPELDFGAPVEDESPAEAVEQQ